MNMKTKEETEKTETEQTTSETETVEVDSESSSDSVLGEGLVLDTEETETEEVETETETEFEEYTLELGEDSALTAEDLEKIAKNAEAYGLTKEQAEAMLADAEATYGQGYNKFEAAIKEHSDTMKAELLDDPAFKTEEARAASFATMGVAVNAFGDENLVNFLKTNAGNNVHLAKFILNIGKLMQSDTPVGKGKATKKAESKSREESLYPEFFGSDTQ